MKQSKVFIPTLREEPAEAESISHKFLLKSGMIKQNARGIYSYLPTAKRVLNKIERIVREEMERIDGVEVLMPVLQPSELWEESGRWEAYGSELMRLKDRNNRDFALGPTHEEIITSLVRDELKSYKRLPITLFQIQSKFRDEKRPRFGLLRGREFIMKDAYSFHSDEESLDETYNDMYNAYHNIFTRVGLKFRPVLADSGAIGGDHTHEFMALAEIGEDTIVYSDSTDFAANIEKAEVVYTPNPEHTEIKELEKVETPDVKTAQALADFLNVTLDRIIKSMIIKVDDEYVMILIRGRHELNDVKLKSFFKTENIELATETEIENIMGAKPGSLGPVNVDKIKIYADQFIQDINNLAVGANEDGYHYLNANVDRDFKVEAYGDFRFILEGEALPNNLGNAKFAEGIEVGQVFKLGTKYSESMNATFLNEQGRAQPLIMGCYGVGISRTLSAVIEQHHDDNGIIWPKAISPYDLHLIAINPKQEAQKELSDQIYEQLREKFDVLYDDRKERAGVKFNDADLIGLPVRIMVGKKASEGIVEVKRRDNTESQEVHVDEIEEVIKAYYDAVK
ncbi:proline--tRNA ligase [Mammaliicoccus lentus]|jgi:prolyl-tRNA synthetase|uniref:proline--tRNA ligase n=1 Tax=Mammaliicoccus lentus TaxID=42858 RepID=UPI00031AFCE9|nr:proline--tRNA ligase [Mammaliicoccus lentus]MBW0766291.1 proline--tRNA ligase [Mammaliicoccus lentus]MDQ7142552.1 proline--tRNA ligase [Mammaliicoccus lentus]QMU10796.1 proline--tRNA ligase [Mammaliicoccus lentus]WGZ43472.1 proline--tRNA ligase [Mammaliicoccus lentus]WHI53783.1 proline--tRNA ligase [Mammaliicoccus lentus]